MRNSHSELRQDRCVWRGRARLKGILSAGLAVLASCATGERSGPPQEPQLARAVAPPDRLTPPEDLPPTARAILRTRMASHARDMGTLMSNIMVLRYKKIEEGASAIAADANLSRPLTGDATELNAHLPAKFFDLQEELKERAKVLAEAAHRMSAFDVADAYGSVSETCVRCHATYREGQPQTQ